MKYYILLLPLLIFSTAYAQTDSTATPAQGFRPKIHGEFGIFTLDSRQGNSSPITPSGFGVFMHPKIQLHRYFSIGLKGEYAKTSSFYSPVAKTSTYAGVTTKGSIKATGSPIFSATITAEGHTKVHKNKTLFIGGGGGIYQLGNVAAVINETNYTIPIGTTLGVEGYAGVNFGAISVTGAVNFIKENDKPMQNRDYISLRVSYHFQDRIDKK